ncbi:hypothetical protein FQN49_005697 [Arthroderma sp. PD_2]|nr:hypothetical protein FQN49_005697 [Arthroderma sp. PD_2]
MFNKDIATGKIDTVQEPNYSTEGTPTTFQIKNDIPPEPEPLCYLLTMPDTCTKEQIEAVKNGTAEIENYIVKSPTAPKQGPPPTSTSSPSPNPTNAGSVKEVSVASLGMSILVAITTFLL